MFNLIVDEFFKMMQSVRAIPVVEWLVRGLALTEALVPTGWPQNYELQDGDRFDFIVVGSGSAGSVVAARLSEVANFNILLLEAGGDPPLMSVIPGLFTTLSNTKYDWKYRGRLDNGFGGAHPGGIVPYIRGKMLGGCSSNNYLIYARGKPEDYDDWNRIAPGWGWDTVLYYFKKLEGMMDARIFEVRENAELHSTKGPVKVSRPVTLTSTATIDEIRLNSYEEMGIEKLLEINGPEVLGASRPHLTIFNGRRSSTAEAYLRPAANRPNLKVAKFAMVTKILIDPQTLEAYGVEVATNNNKNLLKVYATNEVIISAGVINSPKLLMLSGIGPEKDLLKLGIDNIVDLPVGKNFHDHQTLQLVIKGKMSPASAFQNIQLAANLDTVPIPLQSGFFRLNDSFASYPNSLQPHFQFFTNVLGAGAGPALYMECKRTTNFDEQYCASVAKSNIINEIDNILLILLHPLSRGEVTLKSKDPFADPIIDLGFYRDRYDLEVFAEGLKYMAKLVNTTYFRKVRASLTKIKTRGCEDLKWGTDDYWRCFAKNAVTSLQHGVGTCSMGRNGVVNERFQVHSMVGLRVIDASIIPKIPSGNTNAPVIMIGEKAADMIKSDYGVL